MNDEYTVNMATETVLDNYGQEVKLPCLWRWKESDPLAIQWTIGTDTDDAKAWTFAVDLLRTGHTSRQPYGDGDVKVWRDNDTVVVVLSSSATAIFMNTAETIETLLSLIPEEPEELAITDDEIEAFLNGESV